jgi:hypothetical protein
MRWRAGAGRVRPMEPVDRRRVMAPRHLVLAGLLLCSTLAGCSAEVSVGDKDQASGEHIAREIRAEYVEDTGIALPRLTCNEVDGEKGAAISCTGRNARDIQLDIAGKVTDVDGDGFDYTWKIASARAPGVFYERAARRVLAQRGAPVADLRCPAQVELRIGERFRCELDTGSGPPRGLTITLTNLDGGFETALDSAAPRAGA